MGAPLCIFKSGRIDLADMGRSGAAPVHEAPPIDWGKTR